MWAISASKRSRNSRACALRVRRDGWITTNSANSGGSAIGLTTRLPAADVVHRDQARQHRHPVGARDEFERADHGVHLQHGVDLDAVGLEIGFEVAPADVVRAGQHDLERPAVLQPHRRERRQPAARARQQHLAVAHEQPRFQPDPAFEGRHHGEVELVGEHHLGQHAAVALDDVQPHVGMARHEIVERRRQHRAGEGRHQADAQIAGDAPGEVARLLVGALELADRLDAALVVAQPRRRRLHPARRALEQLDAERALDRGDVLRNAGLRGVFARRPRA